MTKYLVIVESPSKSKTIENYLGKDYKVVSSKGHIRDLSTSGKYGFGIDLENNFKPNYMPIKGKKKVINEMKKEALKVDKVFLATDPDREGEAISWHLKEALEIDETLYDRVVFNEITKKAVLEAFLNVRKIDNDLVKSQETRRMLDRIIGFRLSKLIQSKTGSKSAGRVQSVALRLVVDREREIEAFKEEEYWEIKAVFNDFEAMLEKYMNKKIEIKTERDAKDIINNLSNAFKIVDISKTTKNKKSKHPFITSTMQQEASTKLNFGARKTMTLAQKLYEGLTLKDETVGLITYMRTDSTRLSDDFIGETYNYIEQKYGKEYVGFIKKNKKKENVQDAHEAIRPTSIMRTPESVKAYLSPDEYKLYQMIYFRALASLMHDAKVANTSIKLENNGYQFKATGSVLIFDGYLKVYAEYENQEDKILPSFEKYHSDILVSKSIEPSQHFTKPPARYTEAKLIKEMEELGIGRPSTYTTTMDTLKLRGYVSVIEKKFHPTEQGIITTDKLQEFFSNIINVEYTAHMEADLDKISEGKIESTKVLKEFYNEFDDLIKTAFNDMEKIAPEETGELCPECDHPLVIRTGKYGKFVACSNYPECKYIKKEEKKVIEVCNCPKCDGKIVEKKTKKGRIFYGCSNYPKCNYAVWDKPTGEKCLECGELLVIKKDKIKCSKCEYEKAK
ncbi:MAG: type I DNA topoisomerase [Bacilli bacterium]